MTCNSKIVSISNTLKKLWLQSSLNDSYIQTKYNGEEEIINNIFSAYVGPLLKDTNNPALIQEWKLNLDDAAYENQIDANLYKPSVKK